MAQEEANRAIQEHIVQLELDKTALSDLEAKIASGISFEEAHAQSMKKASAAAKEHAIQTKGLTGTTDTFIAKQKVVQTELEATANSSKLASSGIKTLRVAVNMLASTAIMWGITKLVEGFVYLSEEAERAKEKLEEIKTEISNNNTSYQNSRKTLEGLRDEYESLAKKAEALGGAQNLANDEYKKYREITSQILGITPQLITGWNDEGTAISNKNNLLQQSIDLLDEEYEKSLRNSTTKSKNKEVAAGVIAKVNEFENSTDTQTVSGTAYNMKSQLYNELYKVSRIPNGLSEYEIAQQIYNYLYPDGDGLQIPKSGSWLLSLSNAIGDDYDKLANSFLDKNNPIYNLFSDEVIDNMIRNADAYHTETQRIVDDRKALYQDYKDQLSLNAQATTGDNEKNAYQQLSESGKAFINEYIDGLDYASVKTDEDFVEMTNDIQKFTKLLASNDDISNLVESIFAPPKENETSEQYVERVQEAIEDIQNFCDVNYIDLPINFVTLNDVNLMTQNVQAFLRDEFDKNVGELSLEDLQIASDQLEIDPSVSLSWDELIQKIQEYKENMSQKDAVLISDKALENVNAYQSELKSLYEALNLLRSGEMNATDIDALIDKFPALSEHIDDLEGGIQHLINERLISLKESFNGVIGEEDLRRIAEYSVKQEALAGAIDETSNSVKNISDAFNTLSESVDYYNQNGYLTLDMLEDIMKLEPKKLAMLMDENKQIKDNTDAYKNYIKIQLESYKQQATLESQLAHKQLEQDFRAGKITWEERQTGWEEATEAFRIKYQYAVDTLKALEEGIYDGTTSSSSSSTTKKSPFETALDNILNDFDNQLSHYENKAKLIEAQLANAETRGYIANKSYYQALQNVEVDTFKLLQDNLAKLNNLMANSNLDKNSDEWHNLQNEIEETTIAMQESVNTIEELNNKMRQVDWDIFDFSRDQEDKLMEEADFLIDLLDRADMFDDMGEITNEGLTTMGLYASNYNAYLEQSIKYAEELKKLEEDIANDKGDTELINRYDDLLEKQREAILASESERDAMISLVEDGIEKQKDAFSELINQYIEARDAQKDLYEYQKKNSEQTRKIADLQKRLISLQGDNSNEARAEKQRIQNELKTERESLEESVFDRYISEQKELLSTIQDEYEQHLDAYLSDATKVISDSIDMVNKSNGVISNTIKSECDSVGYKLSDEMNVVFNKEKGVLSDGFEGVEDNASKNTGVLSSYADSMSIILQAMRDNMITSGDIGDIESDTSSIVTTLDSIYNTLNGISSKLDGKTSNGSNGNSNPNSSDNSLGSNSTTNKEPNASDLLKNVTGKWYASSDGTGNVGSVTTMGADSWKIDKVNEGSEYPYHIIGYKNGKFAGSGWVKKTQLGYKNGAKRIGEDQLAWTQEEGLEYIVRPSDGAILTPLTQGDSVLNAMASKNLWDMANNPNRFIMDNLNLRLPEFSRNTSGNNIEQSIDITIPLTNVTNVNDFLREFQSNPKVKAIIKDTIAESTIGGNSLAKYRHKF